MHPQVRWVLSCQLLVTLVAALAAGVAQGVHAAVSAALGGGIGVISAYAYVWRALRGSGSGASDSGPKKAFHAQVLGEGYKFAVTILLFTLVFKGYGQLAALPLFLAYAATIAVYWMALLKRR